MARQNKGADKTAKSEKGTKYRKIGGGTLLINGKFVKTGEKVVLDKLPKAFADLFEKVGK